MQEAHDKEDSPWGDIRGKALTARKLASLLKPYGIRPCNIRENEAVAKGYKKVDFLDAWKRYLPLSGDLSATSATPDSSQLQNDNDIYPLQTLSKVPDVADMSRSYDSYDVADVAEEMAPTRDFTVLGHQQSHVSDQWSVEI